ncbi:aldo/keto reductase [Marinimicrobium locisalis]|uniref:aldo/keto reductase n=1 Tax=Marinimicrobium locisalis TaxID=546022 RepID=UPI003221B751
MAPVRVILQARTDSTRLPAKALLPIAGVPSAVLAAKRAANRGHEVLLATTSRPVDDELAEMASREGINTFRGPAENVRLRFIEACSDMNNDSTIVRLTADNLLPDGDLIEQCITFLHQHNLDYVNTEALFGACPYGLSVEAFRLGALKRSVASSHSSFDQEHVTPPLRSMAAADFPTPHSFPETLASLRCTMDTFEDYLNVSAAFRGAPNPVAMGWKELLFWFPHPDGSPTAPYGKPRLVLGTAQLAAPYGTIRQTAPPSPSEAVDLVRAAIDHGVRTIDTASAYSGSERLVGRATEGAYRLKSHIVTKLSPLSTVPPEASSELASSAAENSILRSLVALGGEKKPSILLHRFQHKKAWNGAVWQTLLRFKEEGLVEAVGVSVQTPKEALEALEDRQVRLIQIPYNLLDWRWEGFAETLKTKENPPEVHARSLFLQGILLGELDRWPVIDGADPKDILSQLNHFVAEFHRESLADLCVAWARSKSWLDGLVIGMENHSQLYSNLRLFKTQPLTPAQADKLSAQVGRVPERLLNPALWV